MKCEFCGAGFTAIPWYFDFGTKRVCSKCKSVCAKILTREINQPNSREVMIGQHQFHPARKLLELKRHSITVFLSESLDVIAMEIESRVDQKILRWNIEGQIRNFEVRNIGSSYSNRDEMIPCLGFDVVRLFEDIELSRNNLQDRVQLAIDSLRAKLPQVI